MLNFVICDDNLNILDRLEKMLSTIFDKNNFEAKVTFKSDNTNDILDYVDNNKVDVLLLDINLKSSSKSGLDIAKEIRKRTKPITYDRLEDTIIRLFEDVNGSPKRYLKIDSKNTLVDEAEVQYIKRDGMKLVFHTAVRDYDTYSSFNKFQDKLPNNYIRCHKSCIANIAQIKDVEPVTGTITFKDGNTCDIGPKYKSDLMEVLKNYGNFE